MKKIFVIGSVKINSWWRKFLFINNLNSLKTIKESFCWNLNIVGKYSEFCRQQISKIDKDAVLTNDDGSSYYDVIKKQIISLPQDPETLLFFWHEDHWFVCPHKNLFLYLLDKFQKSNADMLRITHLPDFWDSRELFYKLIIDKPLYKEYLVDLNYQKELWKKYPGSYLTTTPGIFKKGIALEMLETNKLITSNQKRPAYELFDKGAETFLAKRSFIEIIPTFHVFREVFVINIVDRAMDVRKALKIIKLRDTPDPTIKSWRWAVRLIMAPRILGGRIKIKIKKIIKQQ